MNTFEAENPKGKRKKRKEEKRYKRPGG